MVLAALAGVAGAPESPKTTGSDPTLATIGVSEAACLAGGAVGVAAAAP
jgi:hypothetical protein